MLDDYSVADETFTGQQFAGWRKGEITTGHCISFCILKTVFPCMNGDGT